MKRNKVIDFKLTDDELILTESYDTDAEKAYASRVTIPVGELLDLLELITYNNSGLLLRPAAEGTL